MRTLYLIPARGGSKGIPGKNIRDFAGKPLICHSIDHARQAGASDCDICLSTDSPEIARVALDYGLEVPFLRPAELASDTAGSHEVMIHALDYFKSRGIDYDCLVLLQPTSPLRLPSDITGAQGLMKTGVEMAVSVREARSNPYYGTFETTDDGFLHISKGDGHYTRRQDAPKAWEYNGAVYVIDTAALRQRPISRFDAIVPFEMPADRSVDLDTPLDWTIAEHLFRQR